MNIIRVNYLIHGISPLLMHNPEAMLVAPDTSAKTKASSIPTPQEEAERGCYRLPDGVLYMKPIGCKRGLLVSAINKRIGKISASKLVKAGVFEADEVMALFHPETGEPLKDYEIHLASVVVQRARIIRARPRLFPWACYVPFDIDLDYISVEQVEQLLNEAGLMAGLGDFRPGVGGRFGRYKVVDRQIAELAMAAE